MSPGIVASAPRRSGVVWRILSIAALMIIVVTIPVILLVVGGWPLAHLGVARLGRAVFSRRSFDPDLVAHWMARAALMVAWLSWMWMTVCVVVEVRSWVGGQLPIRLPASRALQSAAACLVGTALAVSAVRTGPIPGAAPRSSSTAVGSPLASLPVIDHLAWSTGSASGVSEIGATPAALVMEDPPRLATVELPMTMEVVAAIPVSTDPPRLATHPEPGRPGGGFVTRRDGPLHRVLPRETLWSIASDELGSAVRWKELAELNYGIRQADGGELTSDHWITAGWLLRLPAAEDSIQPVDRKPPPATSRADIGSSPTVRRENALPEPDAPASGAPLTTDEHLAGGNGPWPRGGAPLIPVGGSILSAGVVSILDRMRRAQQRHRVSGGLIRLPDRSRGMVEQRLRIGGGSEITSDVDASLRLLQRHWHDCPGAMPVVRGARITDETIELVVDGLDPTIRLPDSVAPGMDGTSIVVHRSDALRRSRSVYPERGLRSPAPLLVTAGRSIEDTVLVNVEALGSLVVAGDLPGCDAVVRALALELATSYWAGQFEVVVVGFGRELERFTGVTSTSDPPALIRSLCHRRVAAHRALSSTGFRSYAEARGTADTGGWEPIVVICGSSTDESVAAEVLEAGSDANVGMAVIAVGPGTDAGHVVTLGGTDSASSLGLLGSVVFPQTIDAEEEAAVADLLDTASRLEPSAPSAEPYVHLSIPVPGLVSDPPATSIRMDRFSTGSPPGGVWLSPERPDDLDETGRVVVKVLGTVEVRGADREFTRAWAKELVVYLALHPNGASNEAWATALWPDRLMAPSSLHSTASVARRSLGTTPDGKEHLPRSHGRLALAPSVVTDWQLFTGLVESEDVEDRRAALSLVRGRPFDGLRSSDWPILEGIGPAIESAIVDVSGRLAGTYLSSGDPSGAEWSARKGLLASPYDERLYRMLMRAADLAGNPAGVESVMSELVQLVADDVEPFDSVHPSTIDLYRSLTRRKLGSRPRRP